MNGPAKGIIRFLAVLAGCIFGAWLLLQFQVITPDGISALGIGFQWGIVAVSILLIIAVLAGTRMLRGMAGIKRISRLLKHHYLDNLYRAAFCAVVGAVITAMCGCVLGTGAAPLRLWNALTSLGTYCAIIACVCSLWAGKELLVCRNRPSRVH